MDCADVRVVQRGRSLGFPLESAESLCVIRQFVGKELQSDVTVQLEVFRSVDHAHSSAAEFFDNAVMRDGLTNHWRECYVQERIKSMKAEEMARLKRMVVVVSRYHSLTRF